MRSTKKRFAIACLGLVLVIAVEAQQPRKKETMKQQPQVEYLTTPRPRPAPFSDAVRVGDMLYLSGKLGTDNSGRLVPGGIQAETKQTMENIRSLLERNGSSLANVVKCTVMLADMGEWGAMNEVYVTFFAADRRPARSAFGVSGLALNARVEIECLATIK
ncbi:MAG TPA: RidA family protein [Pyrinomonadaceae bacterium]|nr:RidA family protein [Pyrinomonadaceae bacterium]